MKTVNVKASDWVNKHIGQPRSDEYKAGLMLFYDRKVNGLTKTKLAMPYKVGSVEADAFLAGYEAGLIFWDAEQ